MSAAQVVCAQVIGIPVSTGGAPPSGLLPPPGLFTDPHPASTIEKASHFDISFFLQPRKPAKKHHGRAPLPELGVAIIHGAFQRLLPRRELRASVAAAGAA